MLLVTTACDTQVGDTYELCLVLRLVEVDPDVGFSTPRWSQSHQ